MNQLRSIGTVEVDHLWGILAAIFLSASPNSLQRSLAIHLARDRVYGLTTLSASNKCEGLRHETLCTQAKLWGTPNLRNGGYDGI